MKSSLRIHVINPMRKTKIQKAWRNICEVVVLIVIHTLYNPYSPCQITLSMLWTKGQQWWQRKSSFSCLGFSFRIVCLLYPTYYIVKVDPFPEFGDEYVNIMIKSDENNIVTYMYIYTSIYTMIFKKMHIIFEKTKPSPVMSSQLRLLQTTLLLEELLPPSWPCHWDKHRRIMM